MKKIGVAADHAGFNKKSLIVAYLRNKGYTVIDFGTSSTESVDYPDFAHKLGKALENGDVEVGVTFCYSGNGINITMNKHNNVLSALCWNKEIARLARAHNNANACSIPSNFVTDEEAIEIIDTFLSTDFEGGRHQRRISKIDCISGSN